MQVYHQMEEEADAAEDEAEDEHEVDEEPGQDQAAVVARGGNHEEDRGGEAKEEGGECFKSARTKIIYRRTSHGERGRGCIFRS